LFDFSPPTSAVQRRNQIGEVAGLQDKTRHVNAALAGEGFLGSQPPTAPAHLHLTNQVSESFIGHGVYANITFIESTFDM